MYFPFATKCKILSKCVKNVSLIKRLPSKSAGVDEILPNLSTHEYHHYFQQQDPPADSFCSSRRTYMVQTMQAIGRCYVLSPETYTKVKFRCQPLKGLLRFKLWHILGTSHILLPNRNCSFIIWTVLIETL